jgi:hypothetical protein
MSFDEFWWIIRGKRSIQSKAVWTWIIIRWTLTEVERNTNYIRIEISKKRFTKQIVEIKDYKRAIRERINCKLIKRILLNNEMMIYEMTF